MNAPATQRPACPPWCVLTHKTDRVTVHVGSTGSLIGPRKSTYVHLVANSGELAIVVGGDDLADPYLSPRVRVTVAEAAELGGLLRLLGHADIADAVAKAITLAEATAAEQVTL